MVCMLAFGGITMAMSSGKVRAESIEPGSKGPIDIYVIAGQSNAVGSDTKLWNVKDEADGVNGQPIMV